MGSLKYTGGCVSVMYEYYTIYSKGIELPQIAEFTGFQEPALDVTQPC